MEIKYFRLIKTIADEGSLANSSEKLFLTQSALSHQLKDLEQQLGFKVFHRKRNKWKLTEEGSALYKVGDAVLGTIEKGFKDIEQIRTGSKGVVRVSTECYSFYQGLSLFIQKMGVLYPEIDVVLILEATHKPISKILSKEIDVAIVTSEPLDESLSFVEVCNDEILAIMHKENSLAKSNFIKAEDFLGEHLIIHSYPLETVSVYEKFLNPNKIKPLKISAIPLTEVALEMISANMGITCMPKWALSSFNLPKDLLFKKLGKEGVKRKHYLVYRKEDRNKKYIVDFISNFQEHIQMNTVF